MTSEARRAAEQAARQSYGKLIAFLAARFRDVPAAEDALSDAITAALATWPERGIPDNPEAWLLVSAKRNLLRRIRHENVKTAARERIMMAFDEAEERMNADNPIFPDERLKLLFVCTHPALDRSAHTPLMLQTVLAIDAATIAKAFLVSPQAMSQRLVRAKIKIRDANIPFVVPDRSLLQDRLESVLSAIYAAYGLGWDGVDGETGKQGHLADEAIWLGRTLLATLPEDFGLQYPVTDYITGKGIRLEGNPLLPDVEIARGPGAGPNTPAPNAPTPSPLAPGATRPDLAVEKAVEKLRDLSHIAAVTKPADNPPH